MPADRPAEPQTVVRPPTSRCHPLGRACNSCRRTAATENVASIARREAAIIRLRRRSGGKAYCEGTGKEAKISSIGNALTEHRHGLVVEAELGRRPPSNANPPRPRSCFSPGSRGLTPDADKAYDGRGFSDDLRNLNATPHIA